jgi:pimeloyl-ACP methyl ester carboxylesterase
MARFLLVHGAFHGAWCWADTLASLHALGHEAEAVDLPGAGDDPTPVAEVTLDAYVDRVCAALRSPGGPVVLVGHSMGGVVITQAAARLPEAVSALVYVAAFLPADGQSLVALTQLPEGAGDGVQANMVVAGDPPVATMPADAARAVFYGECDDEVAARAVARIGRQPVLPFLAPVDLPAGSPAVRRSYLVATRDRAIPPGLQRRMARDGGATPVLELDADHSPFLSRPEDFVAALVRLGAEPESEVGGD